MSYYGYKRQETAGEKRDKAARKLATLRKKNPDIAPVIIEGRTLARSWWGKAWNLNLESYADYANRIGRGKTYVRNGAVLDLRISRGSVDALVLGSGSKTYNVRIVIDTLNKEQQEQIIARCNHRIDSLEGLVDGTFPRELASLFTDKTCGLFPSPGQIRFGCDCPDWAYMCKHVAAVLYGIGSRLDEDPMMFFTLRDMDSQELVRKSIDQKVESMLQNAGKKSSRAIPEEEIGDLFGL